MPRTAFIILVDICLVHLLAFIKIRYSGIGPDKKHNFLGLFFLLYLIIAKLTDDLAGLLTVERNALARTIIEICGPTLRGPSVCICGMTPEVSRRTA